MFLFIFHQKAKITWFSSYSLFFLAVVLIYGIMAYASKDADKFVFQTRHHPDRFWRYNKPTAAEMQEFWLRATIYFAPVPFYIPVIFFSTKVEHCLWSILLSSVPQFVFVGMGISKMLHDVKEEKKRQKQLEKERIEQEKKEELGRWK